jgi:hypothetical protein
MNYLRSFLEEKKRTEKPVHLPDKTAKTGSVSFVSESSTGSGASSDLFTSEIDRNRWPETARLPLPLQRCGSLVCPSCRVHSPSPHKSDCESPRFEACRSRWFWLSSHGAIKCVACAAPDNLGLIDAWVLARENGEGNDGFGIPSEVLSLLANSGSEQGSLVEC